jgi:hypothetical protein
MVTDFTAIVALLMPIVTDGLTVVTHFATVAAEAFCMEFAYWSDELSIYA